MFTERSETERMSFPVAGLVRRACQANVITGEISSPVRRDPGITIQGSQASPAKLISPQLMLCLSPSNTDEFLCL